YRNVIRNALRRLDDVLDCAGFEIRASEVVRFYLLHGLRVRRRFEYGVDGCSEVNDTLHPPGRAYPLCAKAGSAIQEGEKNFLLKSRVRVRKGFKARILP